MEILVQTWGLNESSARGALKGAETLGLLTTTSPTARGRAYADLARIAGFDFQHSRPLTAHRHRLVRDAPALAALLRLILLDFPPADLVVSTLALSARSLSGDQLAHLAVRQDDGLARALFGDPPGPGQPWAIPPWTGYQLKAMLYDVGLIDTPLGKGAGRGGGVYDPRLDEWSIGSAVGSLGATPAMLGSGTLAPAARRSAWLRLVQ
jgi:hypothetical protein